MHPKAHMLLTAAAFSVLPLLLGCNHNALQEQALASALSSAHIPKATIDSVQRMRLEESGDKGGAGLVATNTFVDVLSRTNILLFAGSNTWSGESSTNNQVVA